MERLRLDCIDELNSEYCPHLMENNICEIPSGVCWFGDESKMELDSSGLWKYENCGYYIYRIFFHLRYILRFIGVVFFNQKGCVSCSKNITKKVSSQFKGLCKECYDLSYLKQPYCSCRYSLELDFKFNDREKGFGKRDFFLMIEHIFEEEKHKQGKRPLERINLKKTIFTMIKQRIFSFLDRQLLD